MVGEDDQKSDIEIISALLKLLSKEQKDIAINYLHNVIDID